MAVKLDKRARAAVARRRTRGHEGRLELQLETIPVRGVSRVLTVRWAPRRRGQDGMVERQVGDTVLHVDPRIARYAQWHDVTVSCWSLGPYDRPFVVDEPYALPRMQEWERSHPLLRWRPAALRERHHGGAVNSGG